MKKNQSARLTKQHEKSQGVVGIFGKEAHQHDADVSKNSRIVTELLKKEFPMLTFRYRKEISKKEINAYLQKIDKYFGQTLFVKNASIRPDGGIIEVKDDNDNWRVVVVSEAKHQGKDIENIRKGILVGTKKRPGYYGCWKCYRKSIQKYIRNSKFYVVRTLLSIHIIFRRF